jgi:hypothetical protein
MRRILSYLLFSANLCLLALVLLGFNRKQDKLELSELVIKGSGGSIQIGSVDGVPQIAMLDAHGQKSFLIKDRDIVAYGKNDEILAHFGVGQDGMGQIRLADTEQYGKVFLQGGKIPGVFLKNKQNKTVGSWSLLPDGGAGLGLGDSQGRAASVIRGGATPSISFFNEQSEPMAALGMIQHVPHMLISGPAGNEGILIHGGETSSMVFVDELGKIKILISKHGVFQGKEKQGHQANEKENKVFSLEGAEELFPEQKEIL